MGKYHVAIRRADNKIYVGTANVDGVLNFDFAPLPAGTTAFAPAIAWDPLHNKVIIAFKGLTATNLWVGNMNADGSGFSGLTASPIGVTSSPAIAWNSNTNKLQYAITAASNTVWVGSMSYTGTGASQVQLAGTVGSAPAIAIATTGPSAGKVQLAVRSNTLNRILAGNVNPDGTSFGGWQTLASGSTLLAPAVSWNVATNKLDVAYKGTTTTNVFKEAINGDSTTGFIAPTQVSGAVSTDRPAAGMDPLLPPLNIFTLNGGNVSGYTTTGL